MPRKVKVRSRSVRKTAAAAISRQPNNAKDRASDLAFLVRSFLMGAGTPPADRKRIRPGEKLPLELNARECELILEHTFAGEELTDHLRIVPRPGQPRVYRFSLDDLDELSGYVATEANHAKDKKLKKELDRFARISSMLNSYTDEDDGSTL